MTVKSSRLTRSAVFFGALVAAAGSSGTAAASPPAVGDGSVLAPIAAQAHYCAGQPGCNGGFPEGVAVVDDRVYVAGPATFGTAGKGPSVVTVLRRSNGQLITEIPIAGEQLAFEHALSGIAVDAAGDVFVVSTQLGVIRIHRHGNRYQQSAYAPPLPDLPACAPGGPQPCAPTPIDLPPLSNELAFDAAGNLYVTDSLQATIFRIPAGGGAIAPWFSSPLLAGNLGAPLPFGANGLRSRITAANGSPIPLDNPAVMAFDDARESILVTNHAIFGDPAHFAVLRIFVGERGAAGPDDDGE